MICTLTPAQQEKVLASVAKYMKTIVDNGGTFDFKGYLNDFYNKRKAALSTVYDDVADQEAKALDFTRFAGHCVNEVLKNPLIDDYMADKIDYNEIKKAVKSFKNETTGLANVRSFLGVPMNPMFDLALANEITQTEPVNDFVVDSSAPISNVNASTTTTPSGGTAYAETEEEWQAAKPTAFANMDNEADYFKDKNHPDYNKPSAIKAFYFKVKRKILNRLIGSSITGEELNLTDAGGGGTFLTIMPIQKLDKSLLSIKDTNPRENGESNYDRNEPVMVLTAKNGYVLRFDENGDYNEQGKPAYYYLKDVYETQVENGKVKLYRQPPSAKLNNPNYIDDYKRVEALIRQSKRTQTPLTQAQAEAIILKQLQQIYDIRKALKNNPDLTIQTNITGGSKGYSNMDYNVFTQLKDVNKDQKLIFTVATVTNAAIGEEDGTTYLTTTDTGSNKMPVKLNYVSSKPEIQNKILDLIFEDILLEGFGGTTSPITNEDRLHLAKQYFNFTKTGLEFDNNVEQKGYYRIDIFGTEVYKSFPKDYTPTAEEVIAKKAEAVTARAAVEKYFSTPILSNTTRKSLPAKTLIQPHVLVVKDADFLKPEVQDKINQGLKAGKIVYFNNSTLNNFNSVSYPYMNINKKANTDPNFISSVIKTVDGKTILKKVTIPYTDYIRNNFFVNYPLSGDKKLYSMNPYFTFEISDAEQRKVNPLPVEPAAIPVAQAPITDSNADNSLTGLAGLLDDPSFQKNLDQKRMDVKATMEQIEEAKAWYENHPMSKHIKFEAMFNMINSKNPNAVANWTVQGITLFKGADFSDLYHEAWHGFTQGFLTKAQKKALYKEVSNKKGSFIDHKGRAVLFSKANEEQLEEYLAEDFRTWMLSGAKFVAKPTIKQSIFQKILEFLRALLGDIDIESYNADTEANNTIHTLYEKLRVGNLNEYTFSQDNFTVSVLNKGPVALDPKSPQSVLTYENGKFLTDTMDSFMAAYTDMAGTKFREKGELHSKTYKWTSTLLKTDFGLKHGYAQVKEDLVSVHNGLVKEKEKLENVGDTTAEEFTKLRYKMDALQKKIDTLGWAIENFGNVDDIIKNRPQVGQDVKGMIAYHFLKSKIIPKETKEAFFDETVSEEDVFLKGREGYDKSGNEASMMDLASDEILHMLKSLHKIDVNGNLVYLPGTESEIIGEDGVVKKIGIPQIEDFGRVWNVLVKLLAGTLDVGKMEAKMKKYQKEHPSFPMKQILENKLGPLSNDGAIEWNLWTNFYQSFNKTSVPLLQTSVEIVTTEPVIEEDGSITREPLRFEHWSFAVNPGRASSSTTKIASNWQQAFGNAVPNSELNFIKKDGYRVNYLDLEAVLKAFPTESSLKDREFIFLNGIGMLLEENNDTIKGLRDNPTAVLSFWKTIKNLNDRRNDKGEHTVVIREIHKLKYKYSEAPWFDKNGNKRMKPGGREQDIIHHKADESSNWNYILNLQAQFSDTEGNFSRTNAEGNVQFEHTLNNSLTVIANALNDSDSYQELMSLPWMQHLNINRNPSAKASIWLNSLFDMEAYKRDGVGAKREFKGVKVKLNLENLSGIAIKKDEEYDNDLGVSSASADGVSKLLMDLHMVLLKNAPELMRHADKGTSFSMFLSAIYDMDGTRKTMYANTLDFARQGSTPNYTKGDETMFKNSVLPHMNAELTRIHIMRKMAKENVENFDFNYLERGQGFVVFSKILTTETKKKLLKLDLSAYNNDLIEYLNSNTPAAQALSLTLLKETTSYFDDQTVEVTKMLDKNKDQDGKTIIADSVYQKIFNEANDKNSDLKNVFGRMSDENITTASNRAIKKRVLKKNIDAVKKIAVKSFVANSWIHNIESLAIVYGDLAQYNLAKEEFHKRNAGAGSTGTIYRSDKEAQRYVNQKLGRGYLEKLGIENKYGDFDGSMNTAVVKDSVIRSLYFEEYAKNLIDDEMAKVVDGKKVTKARAEEIVLGKGGTMKNPTKGGLMFAYHKMNEGDGQGWVTFDSYRIMLSLEGVWTAEQEHYYQKIVNKEVVDPKTISTFFPVQKVQYYGPLKTDGLPITAFHKFSLFPLIPGTIKDTRLEQLHDKMVAEGIDYALFESGSKVGVISKSKESGPDALYSDDKTREISAEPFTRNTIHLNYLKNQLAIAPKWKKSATFSTQLRAIIEDGLMESGVPTDFMPGEKSLDKKRKAWAAIKDEDERKKESENYRLVKAYENNVRKLTEIKKQELLDEMEWKMVNGQPTGSLDTLLKFVRAELKRQDMGDHEIDFIDLAYGGKKLKHDLSISLSAEKIEKMLNAITTRRLINQKVTGEGLIQVSGAGFESLSAYGTPRNFDKPSAADLKKWGTNDLPTYTRGADGKTLAMKVKIAMQGNFKKLLQLRDKKGRVIGTVENLNKLLKDDAWLDMGDHRRMITMVGVRIPVQGLNSSEFMEVYEFLPELAGNIIVPPAEIVAKSGADYDIDKLTIMMPSLSTRQEEDGTTSTILAKQYTTEEARSLYVKAAQYRERKNIEQGGLDVGLLSASKMDAEVLQTVFGKTQDDLDNELIDMLVSEKALPEFDQFLRKLNGSKAIENDLIWSMKEILELKSNFVKLVTPNGTDIAQSLATELADEVSDYKPRDKIYSKVSKEDLEELGEKATDVSGTRVLEIGYNLYKHQSNRIGKEVLGLIAIGNKFNPILNRIGAYLNPEAAIKVKKEKEPTMIRQKILLDSNYIDVDGKKAISLGHLYDAHGENRVSEIDSQLINGAVDVAKDAWLFNIQGNKEIAPTLEFLIEAGVPLQQAVYFVSQPLVRQYVEEQRRSKTIFSSLLGTEPTNVMYYRSDAKKRMLLDPRYGFEIGKKQLESRRGLINQYQASKSATDSVLGENNNFSTKDLRDKITTFSETQENNMEYQYDNFDRAAFLHYLELEDMGKALRDIKLNLNVDTTKSKNLFDAQNKTVMIEKLRENGRFPKEIVDAVLDQSPIGSFHIQPFQVEVWKDLFPLRNNKVVNDFMSKKMKEGIIDEVSSTFGDEEKFGNEFRNSIVSFIFQNSISAFDIDNITHYKGEEISDTLSSMYSKEQVTSLTIGAFFKDGKIYVDKDGIKRQFLLKAFEKPVYNEVLGLAVVQPNMINSEQEYAHFVFEREYLRTIYKDISSISNNLEYNNILTKLRLKTKLIKDEGSAKYIERTGIMAYEEFLKQKALENIFNAAYLFRGDNTYADKLVMIQKYMEDNNVLDDYTLLKKLGASSVLGKINEDAAGKKQQVYTNIKILDDLKDPDNINLYHENMLKLSDPQVKKVEDPAMNKMISDYFAKLPLVAFLQSGLTTKGQFALTRIMPQDSFLRMMEKPVKEYIKDMNPLALEVIWERFLNQNDNERYRFRNRHNNYVVPGFSLSESKRLYNQKKTEYMPNPYSQDARELLQKDYRNIATYDTRNINDVLAKELAANNPDMLFVFNDTPAPYLNDATTNSGDRVFRNLAIGNKAGIITYKSKAYRLTKSELIRDLNDEINPTLAASIDANIETIKADGRTPVFSSKGYGQEWNGAFPAGTKESVYLENGKVITAPKSFLYLSKRLYEEFGYVNPGYELKIEGKKVLQAAQYISDNDVREFMSKCYK